jgi:uncharacterized protein YcfJ
LLSSASNKTEALMRIQALLAATMLSASMLSVPTSANAQGYGAPRGSYHDRGGAQVQCQQQQRNQATAGAVVGGLAGAVLGSGVAGRGSRTEGGVLGGLLGAVAGAMIAGHNQNSACQQQVSQNDHDPYSGRSYERSQHGGSYGDPYARNPYDNGGRDNGRDDGDLYGGPEPRGPGGRF